MTDRDLRKNTGYYSYGTRAEISFINRLGTFTRTGMDHLTAVQKYYDAAQRRDNWGDMDKERILEHCRLLLGVDL